MAISLRPIGAEFAAEISGIDLSTPIDDTGVNAIWDAIDHHAVLVFRDQKLTDAQLRDFAEKFGPLEIGRTAARGGKRRLEIPQIGDISNLDINSQVRALTDRQRLDSLGNRLWQADATYMTVPVALGMLHAVKIPPASAFGGGETEFADMRAAYDNLDDKTKAAIADLVAMHDIFWSRGQIGFTEFPPGEREQYPPSPQVLVRTHPVTGRKTLFLSAHASHIRDWPIADAACCCGTSPRMQRSANSSTATNGGSATSLFGITATLCIAAARMMNWLRAICAAPPPWKPPAPWKKRPDTKSNGEKPCREAP